MYLTPFFQDEISGFRLHTASYTVALVAVSGGSRMSRPLNPFDPSRPIDPSRFIGRAREVRELEAALQHARQDRPRHFLITGERGVGKTSFLDYIRRTASEGPLRFAVIDFSINKSTTKLDFVHALRDQLDRILAAHATYRENAKRVWSFLSKFEIAGVSFKGDQKSDNHRDLYREVADALCEVVNRACGVGDDQVEVVCDGVIILVDEVDQSNDDLDIGSFFKYMLERLNRNGCHKVVVGLAGLSKSTEVLVKSHASSLRIFDELPLTNLSNVEVDELLSEVRVIAREGWIGEFTITPLARDWLINLSGGHPQMLHQVGYCAFEDACSKADGSDLVVDESNVRAGAFERRGAIDLIGDIYFREPLESIGDDSLSKEVLTYLVDSMATCSFFDVSRGVGIPVADVKRVLRSLVESGLVAKSGDDEICIRHRAFCFWYKSRSM